MKVLQENNTIVDSSFNNAPIEASIALKDISKALRMVSKNLYKNKIGAVVQEIVSNCYDANKENSNENENIYINIGKLIDPKINILDENKNYISFKDMGRGMSPEFIDDVYFKYFNSTKENTDEFIGGWGLGSKTPLAYREDFLLKTISDKICYIYYIYINNIGKPEILLINQYEELIEIGTTVIIELLSEDDMLSFRSECRKKLIYFNNILLNNYFIHNYEILKANTFIILNQQNHFDYNNLTVSVNNIIYNIDFNLLKLPSIRFEGSITVDISEIDVTISREDLDYTDKTIKTITNKIEKFREEINSLFLINYSKSLNLNNIFKFNLQNVEINIKNICNTTVIIEVLEKVFGNIFLIFKKYYNYQKDNAVEIVNEFNKFLEKVLNFSFNSYYLRNNKRNDGYYVNSINVNILYNEKYYYTEEHISKKINMFIKNQYNIIQPVSIKTIYKNFTDYKKSIIYDRRRINTSTKNSDIYKDILISLNSIDIFNLVKQIKNIFKSIHLKYELDEKAYADYLEDIKNSKNKNILNYKETIYYTNLNEQRYSIKIGDLIKYNYIFIYDKNFHSNFPIKDIITLLNSYRGYNRNFKYFIMSINKTNFIKLERNNIKLYDITNIKDIKILEKFIINCIDKIIINRIKRNYDVFEFSTFYENLLINIENKLNINCPILSNNFKDYFDSYYNEKLKNRNMSYTNDLNYILNTIKKYDVINDINFYRISKENISKIISKLGLTKLSPKYYNNDQQEIKKRREASNEENGKEICSEESNTETSNTETSSTETSSTEREKISN